MADKSPFDEMYNADGSIREPYRALAQWLEEQPDKALTLMQSDAEAIFRNHRGRPHWGKCHSHRASELRDHVAHERAGIESPGQEHREGDCGIEVAA